MLIRIKFIFEHKDAVCVETFFTNNVHFEIKKLIR